MIKVREIKPGEHFIVPDPAGKEGTLYYCTGAGAYVAMRRTPTSGVLESTSNIVGHFKPGKRVIRAAFAIDPDKRGEESPMMVDAS